MGNHLIVEYKDATGKVIWTDGRRNMPERGTVLNHAGKGWTVVGFDSTPVDGGPPVVWVSEREPRKGTNL